MSQYKLKDYIVYTSTFAEFQETAALLSKLSGLELSEGVKKSSTCRFTYERNKKFCYLYVNGEKEIWMATWDMGLYAITFEGLKIRFPMDKIVTCVYCGTAYPAGTPTAGAKILTDHIKTCVKHPMRELEEKNRALEEKNKQLEKELVEAQKPKSITFKLGGNTTVEVKKEMIHFMWPAVYSCDGFKMTPAHFKLIFEEIYKLTQTEDQTQNECEELRARVALLEKEIANLKNWEKRIVASLLSN